MTGQGRRAHVALLGGAAALLAVGVVIAYHGLVLGEFKVLEGRRPRTKIVDVVRGPDAVRLGWGGAALAASGAMLLLNAFLKGRTVRAWRARVALALALLTVTAFLLIPPWRIQGPGLEAGFYAFLIPGLAGASRGARAFMIGAAIGLAGSLAFAYSRWGLVVAVGATALLLLAPHVAFLTSPEGRRRISDDLLSKG